ncbi:gamma-glutamyl-gamma-aminobutyrate hydrolase family protein [Actinomycetospora sp. OC33-EN08]|uniref:Gamma-glutamyl-gamma-aminobutyrate hydrolase family protein n=1 Tax=Actinomycetospora aurantiaca TaxID=3129233 RepID=A0ABU8MUA2_9PSEU
MSSSPTLLVIGHDTTPETVLVQAGTLASWARDRGVTVLPAVAGTELPPPSDVDAIAVLGSIEGAWDDSVPWLASEIAYVERAIAAGTPVLGICFGGQLLARVLGGSANRADGRHENGFRTIVSSCDAIDDGPWMEFHFDSFTAPPTSEVLARSERCDQAFRLGAHLGVQFHPEITPAEFEIWAGRWAGTPLEDRFDELGISTAGLRAEVAERAESSRVRAWRLFDDFGQRAGLVPAELEVGA